MQKSPYKFLDSYSKEDRNIFFGRDKEIGELHSRVFESRILVVYGTSGTGKSSLINCGLANKFNDSDWLPVTVRRGLNINQSLYESLEKVSLTKLSSTRKYPSGRKPGSIAKIIQSVYLDHFKPVFIIFDQFEELFIFGTSEEKDELINSIREVLDSDLQCRFIFCVREEYLAGFTEFEKVIPSILANRIRIEKMTRQNAIRVIEGPCQLSGIDVEPGFSEKLLDKLNPGNPEVELTWLQVCLDKIFRIAQKEGKEVKFLGSELLGKVGEVKDLLGTFLEEQISQLDDPDSGLVMLKSFVSIKGTKQQIREEEVIEYSKTIGKELEKDKVKDLLQKFIRLRILRDKDENGRYELRHDSLAAKIYENITLVEKELLEIRQFLDDAYKNYEKRQLYLTADDLSYISPYEDKLFLNERISKFIALSKRAIHKSKLRRQRVLVSTTIIIIAFSSFFTIWALKERNKAKDQERYANEQRAAAENEKAAADSAKTDAENSRFIAEKEKLQAESSRAVAVKNEKEAIRLRELAQVQKLIAEKNEALAKDQEQIANEEKQKAEEERTKSIKAEAEAKRLGLLSTAQNLALKSSGIEKNPELKGLLAVHAFIFNIINAGRPEDPVIYESLNRAFLALDSSRQSEFSGSPNEIRFLTQKNTGQLFSADLDGQLRTWDSVGKNSNDYTLTFKSPINFIGSGSSGEKMITQHDNLTLLLWDTGDLSSGNVHSRELKGHKGFVRTVTFSSDERFLATAGRDSSLIVWDLSKGQAAALKSVRTKSGVRSAAFISSDTLAYNMEDGSIVLWDTRSGEMMPVYTSETDKPLCLSWNGKRKILVAGCSNGTILLFDMVQGKFRQPVSYPVHTAGIDLIAFNSDCSMMATSSWDRTIKFYFYHEYFDLKNSVGGSEHLKNLDSRVRTMIFTRDNRIAAGMSDKSIRIWETSSEKLASIICNMLKRDMTADEWNEMVGKDIPYQKICSRAPKI